MVICYVKVRWYAALNCDDMRRFSATVTWRKNAIIVCVVVYSKTQRSHEGKLRWVSALSALGFLSYDDLDHTQTVSLFTDGRTYMYYMTRWCVRYRQMLRDLMRHSLWDQVHCSLWDLIRRSLWDLMRRSLCYEVRCSLRDLMRRSLWDQVHCSLSDLRHVSHQQPSYFGVSDHPTLAYYTFRSSHRTLAYKTIAL